MDEGGEPPLVAAATRLETWAARIVLPREVPVRRVGVGLTGNNLSAERPIIACGLAGSLTSALRPGTIVVPEWVALPSGERLPCDPALVGRLTAAARRLGFAPATGPLLTSPHLVTGNERALWLAQGYETVDMETGLLLARCQRTAAVRVVLDAPGAELAADWEQPLRLLLAPRLWPQALRISCAAPAYARRAAAVVRAALDARAD